MDRVRSNRIRIFLKQPEVKMRRHDSILHLFLQCGIFALSDNKWHGVGQKDSRDVCFHFTASRKLNHASICVADQLNSFVYGKRWREEVMQRNVYTIFTPLCDIYNRSFSLSRNEKVNRKLFPRLLQCWSRGKKTHCFPEGPVIKCFVIPVTPEPRFKGIGTQKWLDLNFLERNLT